MSYNDRACAGPFKKLLTAFDAAVQDIDASRQRRTGEATSTFRSSELQREGSSIQANEFTLEQMKTALCNMEQKLKEANAERRILEESRSKSEAALAAMQEELKETQRQLAFMEQWCRLMQDMDNRVGNFISLIILTSQVH